MKKIGIFVALFLMVGVSVGWCNYNDWIEEKANSGEYWTKAGGMLIRGADRIVESPLELACHTYKGTTEEIGHGEGILKGLGTGLLWMGDSILRGAWDIITFAFPDYHGEPGTHVQECWGSHAGGSSAGAGNVK